MITLKTHEDVLAALPHVLGYVPRQTLIFCCLDAGIVDGSGQRFCVGPVIRIDATKDLCCEAAQGLADVVREHGLAVVALVLYCRNLDDFESNGDRERMELIRSTVQAAIDERPGGGRLICYATDTAEYVEINGQITPRIPCTELESREVSAQLVYAGSSPCGEPRSDEPQHASPEVSRRIRQGAEMVQCASEAERADAFLTLCNTLRWGGDIHSQPSANHRGGLPWELLAMACADLDDVAMRDLVLLLGTGTVDPEANPLTLDLAEGIDAACFQSPNISVIQLAVDVLDALGMEDIPGHAQALAVSAYLCWWACASRRAFARVEIVRREDPHNGLASLLSNALVLGMLPPWYAVARQQVVADNGV